MSDRLKQIWSGFEATTKRRLTGSGVENIEVPYHNDEPPVTPAPEAESPAEAAFFALHEQLSSKGRKKASKKNAKARQTVESDGLHEPLPMAEREFNGDELIRGMRATAMRVERPPADYEMYLATQDGKAAYKKLRRKKRFIFF